tara:strand:- start:518 stop:1189 length:672 start_codon:yes stop_codon:yes gene_type:complete
MKRINQAWRLFVESANGGISNLKFGELTRPTFIKFLEEDLHFIDLDFETIPDHPFPENESQQVRDEIEHIIQTSKKSTLSKKELATLDKRATNLFFDFMSENGVHYDKEFLSHLSDDISRFAIKMKMKYQRPRPAQLAPALGYEFSDIPTSSDDSPSYPSGHTLIAWSLALYLSERNPDHKDGFYDIARKIEESRIIRGAHFLSDNVFAKLLARKYVVPNIKE